MSMIDTMSRAEGGPAFSFKVRWRPQCWTGAMSWISRGAGVKTTTKPHFTSW